MSTAQGERRLRLAATRSLLYSLPTNELFELPGRPHVVYQLRTYSNTGNAEEAAQQARNDSSFLFKAFETGQIGPKRLARIHGDKPRVATIHEYLDWTVTAQAAEGDDELDFDGFRVLVILPRYRSGWPPPAGDVAAVDEQQCKQHRIGAPKSPLPALQTHGKPVTAATIRSGPGYLEIPFVATHENKRGRGYCRCLVEAIEDIARSLGLKKLMLCSTNDASVQSTWQHLGFEYASDEQMEEWDILHTDLVYLQNTTQMHKNVPPPRRYKPVVIKHDVFRQRCYAFVGQKRPLRAVGSMQGVSMPPSSRARLSSRRSESTSRDDSQSVAAREQLLMAGAQTTGGVLGSAGGQHPQLESSPVAAGVLAATPQAATSTAGRLPSRTSADDTAQNLQQIRLGGNPARDEAIAGGGPPTPQPADGGPLRPLHAHASIAAPSVSQTDLARHEYGGDALAAGSAPSDLEYLGAGERSGLIMWRSHAMAADVVAAPGALAAGAGGLENGAQPLSVGNSGLSWQAAWMPTNGPVGPGLQQAASQGPVQQVHQPVGGMALVHGPGVHDVGGVPCAVHMAPVGLGALPQPGVHPGAHAVMQSGVWYAGPLGEGQPLQAGVQLGSCAGLPPTEHIGLRSGTMLPGAGVLQPSAEPGQPLAVFSGQGMMVEAPALLPDSAG